MQNRRRKRLDYRPFLRPLRWAFLLLVICALWIGFLRIVLVIPTPADVNDEGSYFSPFPAPLFVPFFRANARLLGWHPWLQQDKYRMSFTDTRDLNGAMGDCVSFSGMYLEIAPGLLWGSYVHWEVRPITLCGHPG